MCQKNKYGMQNIYFLNVDFVKLRVLDSKSQPLYLKFKKSHFLALVIVAQKVWKCSLVAGSMTKRQAPNDQN